MALRLPELIVIFIVALLIFGPKKLPEMGAQIGRSLNAFKKGMSEFNRSPLDDSYDLEAFTAQQKTLRALEAKRLELEILERELSVKRAEAALRATQQNEIAAYSSETTFEEHYVAPETVVEADYVVSEKITHASAEKIEAAEQVEAAPPVETAEQIEATGQIKVAEQVEAAARVEAAEAVETAERVEAADTNLRSKR